MFMYAIKYNFPYFGDVIPYLLAILIFLFIHINNLKHRIINQVVINQS